MGLAQPLAQLPSEEVLNITAEHSWLEQGTVIAKAFSQASCLWCCPGQ